MKRILPIPAEIFQYLRYESETGKLYWKKSPAPRIAIGDEANHVNQKGYIHIMFKGKKYLGHRLAWALGHETLDVPPILDHINCIKTDNRLSNLRAATCFQNSQNQPNKNPNGNLKGAFYQKERGYWYSIIQSNLKSKYLGSFETELEAHAAYCKAAEELHGDFANFG